MTNTDRNSSRRKFLASMGASATAALAGCSGGDDDSNDGEPDSTGNGEPQTNNTGNNESGLKNEPGGNTGINETNPGNTSDPGNSGNGNETDPNGVDNGNGQEEQPNGVDNGNGQDEGINPGELDLELALEPNGEDSGIQDFWQQINVGLDGETGEYNPTVYFEPVETGETQELSPGDEWLPERLADYEIKIEAGDETLQDFEVTLNGEELDNTELTRTDMMNLVNLEGNRDRLKAGLKSMPEKIDEEYPFPHHTNKVANDVWMMQYLDREAVEENRKLDSSDFFEKDEWIFYVTKTSGERIYGLTGESASDFKPISKEVVEREDGFEKKKLYGKPTLAYGSMGDYWVDGISGTPERLDNMFETFVGDQPSLFDSDLKMPESGLPSPVKDSDELVLNIAYNSSPEISGLATKQIKDYDEDSVWLMVMSYDPGEHVFREKVYGPNESNDEWEVKDGKEYPHPYEVNEAIAEWEGQVI